LIGVWDLVNLGQLDFINRMTSQSGITLRGFQYTCNWYFTVFYDFVTGIFTVFYDFVTGILFQAVKLGTITADGKADVYSYAEDNMVSCVNI
jgi:hypothetical protein